MSDSVQVALIAGAAPIVIYLLGRAFGGWRKDEVETEASVATQWQSWAESQGRRIEKLEKRVTDLEASLEDERAANKRLQDQNRRQASMLTALVRWAILLRDEVIRLAGNLPPAPVEVEAAMTTLDP